METKVCSKCGERRPIELYKSRAHCNACERAYNRAWHQKNKHAVAIRKKKYAQENKEHLNMKVREHRQQNLTRLRLREKTYRDSRPVGIYVIHNTQNKRKYIGQSKQLPLRWYIHKSRLKNGHHDVALLQEDYNNYGLNAFEFEVIKKFSLDIHSEILLNEEKRIIREHVYRGEELYNNTGEDKQ